MDSRKALEMVDSLIEQDEYHCTDCGETVDISEAQSQLSVVVALEEHRQEHEGEE